MVKLFASSDPIREGLSSDRDIEKVGVDWEYVGIESSSTEIGSKGDGVLGTVPV